MASVQRMLRPANALYLAAALAVLTPAVVVANLPDTHEYLTFDLATHHSELDALSDRAERLQMLAPHIRNASLEPEPDVALAFAGYVGPPSRVAVGSRLMLSGGNAPDYELEVLASQRVTRSTALAAASGRAMDLVLITGRIVGDQSDSAPVRVLVATDQDKPGSNVERGVGIDQRTL